MGQGDTSRAEPVAVLVLAPLARDAAATCNFLAGVGIRTQACADMDELCAALEDTPRVVLLTEEALAGDALTRLSAVLTTVPGGADVPVLVLVGVGGGASVEQRLRHYTAMLGNVTLITRPVHPITLLSAVHTALRAQRRVRPHETVHAAATARPAPTEQQARRAVDAIPLATFVTRGGRVVYANAAAAALIGVSDVRALQDQPLVRWVHPEFAPATEQRMAELNAGSESATEVEQRWIRRDGTTVEVAMSTAVLPWNGQTAVYVYARDAAAHKAAENEIRLRTALQRAPVTLFQQDRDLRYTWIHNAFSGRPATDFIGRRDGDWLAAGAETEALEAFKRQVVESGDGARRKFRLTFDHESHDFEFVVEPLFDNDGHATGIAGAALHVDEYAALQDQLRRQVEQLARMDQRKNDFMAQLAHELRNPLAPIHNAVHVLRIQPEPPDPLHVKWALEVIARQVQHLSRLVDDLLDIARITHGGLKLHPEPLELGRALTQAIEAVRPLTAARKQMLTYSPPIEPVRVQADPTRLMQIVGNLLHNAAHYTPTGGHIALSVRREADRAVITVSDDGLGIPPEALAHIFEPFYQADRSAASAHAGLGLGLALVRHLASLHGGTVEARSEGLGQGSEFYVRLPVLPELLPPREISVVPRIAGPGLRILVVDDEPDVAQSFALLLRTMGHEVEVASDGTGALAAADHVRPQVAFIDIGLPDMDGYAVARLLRARDLGPGMRLVALTGYGQDEVRQRATAAGFDAHLVKPATAERVEQLLATFTRPG